MLPETLHNRQGVTWVVAELGKEDGIKGMNTARKISSALLSLSLLGFKLESSVKELQLQVAGTHAVGLGMGKHGLDSPEEPGVTRDGCEKPRMEELSHRLVPVRGERGRGKVETGGGGGVGEPEMCPLPCTSSRSPTRSHPRHKLP